MRTSQGLTQGCAPGSQVQRGGWAAGRGEYRLLVQAAGEAAPRVDKVAFSGLEDELAAFVAQAHAPLHYLMVLYEAFGEGDT